jgi:hypothetical protein
MGCAGLGWLIGGWRHRNRLLQRIRPASLPRISRAFCSVRAGVPVQRFENSEVFPRRNGWFDWSKSHVVEHNMCNRSSEPQQPDYPVYLYL